jgi:hypothetical protein
MHLQPWKTVQATQRGWCYALYAVIAVLLVGCGEPDRIDNKPATPAAVVETLPDLEPPKPGKDGKVDPVEQAKYDYERFTSAAAKAGARYKLLRRVASEEALDAQVNWITGIALIVAAVAGVACFLVPIGKKTLVGLAIGCTVIAACAQAFREAVPYLPWIGGALIVGAGIWVAFNWRKLGQTVQAAADHGERLEQWLIDDVLPNVDDKARALIASTISGVKSESKQQAERLGVHNPLQYLRGKTQTLWQRLFS